MQNKLSNSKEMESLSISITIMKNLKEQTLQSLKNKLTKKLVLYEKDSEIVIQNKYIYESLVLFIFI